MTNSIADLEDAEVILIVGSNTTEQHPIIGERILAAARSRIYPSAPGWLIP